MGITALLIVSVVISVTSCPEVVDVLLRVAQPQFTPVAGTFTTSVDVTITCQTEGSSIRYTMDGSTPTSTAGTLYAAPVHLTGTTTIKALAYKEGQLDSPIASGTYTKSIPQVYQVTFSPMINAWYNAAQDVTMSCATAGAHIRFTTDGSQPTSTTGTIYTAPVRITQNTTFNAIACKEGMQDSEISTGAYYVSLPKVATPTFSSKTPGSFGDHTYITFGCETSGATILYTLDDSEPTRDNDAALEYTGRFSIYNTHTIKAFAYKDGMVDSDILSGKFWPTKVDEPDFSHVGGPHRESIDLEITTETLGATVEYTLNGSDRTEYEQPIKLDKEGEYVFVAQAYLTGLQDSDTNYETITLEWLDAGEPQFNPGAGNFDDEVVVTISANNGAKIRFTCDGSDPTPTHGTEYTGPITITSSMLVKALAYGDELDSGFNKAKYGIIGPAGGWVIVDKGKKDFETMVLAGLAVTGSGYYSTKDWRFIEVAPVDFTTTLAGSWAEGLERDPVYHMFPSDSGEEDQDIEGTFDTIGSGWANTNLLVNSLSGFTSPFGAKACAEFASSVGATSHVDWALPSKQELQLIAQRLGDVGLKLMDGMYLSSTLDLTETYPRNWRVQVGTGAVALVDDSFAAYVRPIRLY